MRSKLTPAISKFVFAIWPWFRLPCCFNPIKSRPISRCVALACVILSNQHIPQGLPLSYGHGLNLQGSLPCCFHRIKYWPISHWIALAWVILINLHIPQQNTASAIQPILTPLSNSEHIRRHLYIQMQSSPYLHAVWEYIPRPMVSWCLF